MALRSEAVRESCQSDFHAASRAYYLMPASWSKERGHEGQNQRERKVQEQHQQAAAGAPPACARLGNALDLPLFTAGDNSLS